MAGSFATARDQIAICQKFPFSESFYPLTQSIQIPFWQNCTTLLAKPVSLWIERLTEGTSNLSSVVHEVSSRLSAFGVFLEDTGLLIKLLHLYQRSPIVALDFRLPRPTFQLYSLLVDS